MLERGDDPIKVEERIENDRREFSYKNIGSTTFVIQGDNLTISQISNQVYEKYMGKEIYLFSKNGVLKSALDGIGMGLGFTLGLTTLGIVREISRSNIIY